jgi:hypothetical protein
MRLRPFCLIAKARPGGAVAFLLGLERLCYRLINPTGSAQLPAGQPIRQGEGVANAVEFRRAAAKL